jgi:hypothetical protein
VGRGIGAEPQAERRGLSLQNLVYDAWLDSSGAGLAVDLEHAVEVSDGVDHHAPAHGVSSDRSARATHGQRHLQRSRDVDHRV